MSCGVLVIILGVILLLENLNIIPKATWDIFWPVILIFLGIGMITSSKRSSIIVKKWHNKDQ